MKGIGIIGTGGIADSAHAPAISAIEGASLVAVLSRDKSHGQAFLEKHNAPKGIVYTSLDSFVSDPAIQLVIICTPDGLHAEQARACLSAGKHVLLEKPMALNIKEAKELVRLAKAKELKLAIGFHLRSHQGHRALLDEIKQGSIGSLRHIRAVWAFSSYDDSNWRAQAELAKWWSLSAVGSHCLDLARWFAGDTDDWKEFSAVTANNIWHGPHDETAVIAGQFVSGPTVEVVSSIQFGPYNRLELFGDKGQAVCEETFGREGRGNITINGKELKFEPFIPFVSQLQNIVESIEGKESLRADGNVGLRSVEDLVLAINA